MKTKKRKYYQTTSVYYQLQGIITAITMTTTERPAVILDHRAGDEVT